MIYTNLLAEKRFESHEQWIKDNLLFEAIMGSNAYGCNTAESDIDIVAIVMPKDEVINPQKYGYISGFETVPNFESKEVKGEGKKLVLDNGKDIEGEFVSLIRFFFLAGIKGSPNLIETLFVRDNLITFNSKIGGMLRDNRKKFLSLRTFNSMKGYTWNQIERIRRGVLSGKTDNSKRQAMFDKTGFDCKMAGHCLRLLDNLNQLLDYGNIDLMNNKEEVKNMRNGTWGDFNKFVTITTERLEAIERKALTQNALSISPQSGSLKILLRDCIEEFYGSDSNAQKFQTEYVSAKMVYEKLDEISSLLGKTQTFINLNSRRG